MYVLRLPALRNFFLPVYVGDVVQFSVLRHPMVSPRGPALLPGDIHCEWQLWPPPSENQIPASGPDRTPYAKAQRSPSIRWQTSQPCVRNFWSKIDWSAILLFGCSLYGCGVGVDYSDLINDEWVNKRSGCVSVFDEMYEKVGICCFFIQYVLFIKVPLQRHKIFFDFFDVVGIIVTCS